MIEVGDIVVARKAFWFGPIGGKRFEVTEGTRGKVMSAMNGGFMPRTIDVLFDGTTEYVRVPDDSEVIEPVQVTCPRCGSKDNRGIVPMAFRMKGAFCNDPWHDGGNGV